MAISLSLIVFLWCPTVITTLISGVFGMAGGLLFLLPLLAAMTETGYRHWAGRIVTTIALFYMMQGGWLLLRPE